VIYPRPLLVFDARKEITGRTGRPHAPAAAADNHGTRQVNASIV